MYDGLVWAREVSKAMEQGLASTLSELNRHMREIELLPKSGAPGKLKQDLAEVIEQAKQRLAQSDFYKHSADLRSTLTSIQSATRDTAIEMATSQKLMVAESQADLQNWPDWKELTQEERSQCFSQVEELTADASEDLDGLKSRISQDYVIGSRVSELKKSIEQTGSKRRLERLELEKEKAKKAGKTKLTRTLKIPMRITNVRELDELIVSLQKIREELEVYAEIEIDITHE